MGDRGEEIECMKDLGQERIGHVFKDFNWPGQLRCSEQGMVNAAE